jgi:hypothetical protein
MAEARGVKGSIAGTVYQTLVQASELGYGDKFIPSLIEAQEKINKIVIIPR